MLANILTSCLSVAVFPPLGGAIFLVGEGLVKAWIRLVAATADASAKGKLVIVQSCGEKSPVFAIRPPHFLLM